MKVIFEPAEDFVSRTRNGGGSNPVADFEDVLAQISENPGKVFTIVKDEPSTKCAAIVAMLNREYDNDWTFVSRSVPGNTFEVTNRKGEVSDVAPGIVQAKFDPDLPRKVRKPRTLKDKVTETVSDITDTVTDTVTKKSAKK